MLVGLCAGVSCDDTEDKLLEGRPWNGKSARKGSWSQAQAEAFTLLPLYWLGPSYADYNLTDIYRTGAQSVFFTYGNCLPGNSGWFDDTGCHLPFQVRVDGRCVRRIWVQESEYRGVAIQEVRGGGRMVVITNPTTGRPESQHLVVGRVEIQVSGSVSLDPDDVIEQLRGLGMTAAIGPGDPLPPPDLSEC